MAPWGVLSMADPKNLGGEVKLILKGNNEPFVMQQSHAFHAGCRGLGVAEMTWSMRMGRKNRANKEMAYHALEVLHGWSKAAQPAPTRSSNPALEAAAPPVRAIPGRPILSSLRKWIFAVACALSQANLHKTYTYFAHRKGCYDVLILVVKSTTNDRKRIFKMKKFVVFTLVIALLALAVTPALALSGSTNNYQNSINGTVAPGPQSTMLVRVLCRGWDHYRPGHRYRHADRGRWKQTGS